MSGAPSITALFFTDLVDAVRYSPGLGAILENRRPMRRRREQLAQLGELATRISAAFEGLELDRGVRREPRKDHQRIRDDGDPAEAGEAQSQPEDRGRQLGRGIRSGEAEGDKEPGVLSGRHPPPGPRRTDSP